MLSDPRYGSNLNQVGASVKKHEAISADILAREERWASVLRYSVRSFEFWLVFCGCLFSCVTTCCCLRFMDLRNMSEQLQKENYHARAQVQTREKQIMARWQVSKSEIPLIRMLTNHQRWQPAGVLATDLVWSAPPLSSCIPFCIICAVDQYSIFRSFFHSCGSGSAWIRIHLDPDPGGKFWKISTEKMPGNFILTI